MSNMKQTIRYLSIIVMLAGFAHPAMAQQLEVAEVETVSGMTSAVGVDLKDIQHPYNALTFSLKLPEGFSLADDPVLSDQWENTIYSIGDPSQDNTYKMAIASSSEIQGTSLDDLLTLNIHVDGSVASGTYLIEVQNVLFEYAPVGKDYVNDVVFRVKVGTFILGDINGDGKVDVSDYVGIANHILGLAQESFNEQAADVNEDGVIDVLDYVGVANIILTGSIYGSNNAMTKVSAKKSINK